MSLDMPASAQALWALSDATGVRPEYVLPFLYLESGFNPAITNSIGCVGLNQQCPPNVPSGYGSWSASQQIAGVITPSFKNYVTSFGPIRSATRAYQANFLPATLATAMSLDSVLAQRGSSRLIPKSQLTEAAVYNANPGLDANKDGFITVGDLAQKMRQELAAPAVQSAIAQTYAQRPGESPVADPALGTDFPSGLFTQFSRGEQALIAVAVLATAAGAAALARPAWLHDLAARI